MVFQHFGLLPWKTVYDNAAFGLTLAGAPAAVIRERVTHYLDLVGLSGFEQHYPYQLSGGMQQRVGLVRALAIDPKILLMDEPFASLDAQTREILQEELLRIMERLEERKTMVFITHSIDEAILLGDRIAVMTARPGRIKEIIDLPFGRPRDVEAIRADPRYAELRAHIWHELQGRAAGEGGVSVSVQTGTAVGRRRRRRRRWRARPPSGGGGSGKSSPSRSGSRRSSSCSGCGRFSAPRSMLRCSPRRAPSRVPPSR